MGIGLVAVSTYYTDPTVAAPASAAPHPVAAPLTRSALRLSAEVHTLCRAFLLPMGIPHRTSSRSGQARPRSSWLLVSSRGFTHICNAPYPAFQQVSISTCLPPQINQWHGKQPEPILRTRLVAHRPCPPVAHVFWDMLRRAFPARWHTFGACAHLLDEAGLLCRLHTDWFPVYRWASLETTITPGIEHTCGSNPASG